MSSDVATEPPAPEPWAERLADWAGPLVVKEVRADLRSRAFAAAFGLMLLVGFVVVLVNAALSTRGVTARGGYAFVGTATAFALFGHLLVPVIAYRAMVKEREDETWVLLVLTGLGAAGIVRGKHLSAVAQLGLGAAASAPFMLLSYLLAGVGLLNVVLGVWWHLGLAFLLTSVALGLGAQAESRLERAAGLFVVLALGAGAGLPSLVLSGALAFNGERTLRSGAAVAALALVPVAMVLLGRCVLPAAAAALALDAEARTHPARVRVAWTFALGLGVTVGLVEGLGGDATIAGVTALLTSALLLVVGFFAISERPGYPRLTAADGVRRPGAFRSAALVFLLLGLTAGACLVPLVRDHHRITALAVAAPALAALYLSVGVLLGRLTPLRRLGPRSGARLGFVLGVALGVLGPSLLSLLAEQRPDRGPGWIFNPLFGLARFAERSHLEAEAGLLAAVAGLAALGALVVLFAEDQVRTNAR